MSADKKLIVITGPTAVGKTAMAIRLARHFGCEILSADARQVYMEMEHGTAKPTAGELALVKHHFVNTRSVQEKYNAGMYSEEARNTLTQLFSKTDKVILCGGSGLYIQAVLEGFDKLPEVPSEIRDSIVKEYEQKGLSWLQDEVSAHDPDYFDIVDRQNPQRLMRALEVIRHVGKPFSTYHKKENSALPYQIIKVGLELDRDELYSRIDRRVDKMVEDGLFEEAATLYPLRHLNALQTVGYQEIFGFMEGLYLREEAIRLLKRNTRHYAKRQLTWFKRDPEFVWFHPDEDEKIISFVEKVIS